MAMTDRLSLDVGSAPLLWAVPLGLFLLAFAQAYMRCSPLGYGPLAARAPLHVLLGLGLAVALGIALIMLLSGRGAAGQEHGLLTIACGAVFAFIMMTPTVWLTALQPFVVMLVIFVDGNMFVTSLGRVSSPFLVLHLTGFYWSSRVCFGALAADRPAASAVTGYYAWIGVGGLVGGACQLLLVPMLFRNYLEFAFLAALATTLRTAWLPYGVTDWLLGFVAARNKDEAKAATVRHRLAIAFDLAFAVALATAAGLLFHARSLVAPFPPIRGNLNAFVRDAVAGFNDYPLVAALVAPVFLLARPWRCGLVLAAIAALCVIEQESQRKERVVERQRNAFGSLKVVEDTRRVGANVQAIPGGLTERRLVQGTTMQGAAFTSPKELGRMPTTYYHRKGPVGKIMSAMEWFREPGANIRNDPEFWLRQNVDNAKDDARIITSLVGNGVALGQAPLGVVVTPWSEPPYAFIGLGAGNLFAYARPLQIVDAYELDAAVIDLSKRVSPAFPHYKAAKERGVQVEIIAGDARRSLALTRADGFYTAIFVDAFNSASIPTHLLTVEAIELYFQKLTGDGIICFHISNRHVELKGVLDKAAQKLKVPLFEMKGGDTEPDIGFEPSHWVCLTRNESMQRRWHTAGFFPQGGGPVRPAVPPPREAWTDEHANVLDAIHPSAGWTRFVYAVLIMILLMALCVGAIEVVFAALPRSMEPRAPSAS
jgi:hypothetical protein